MPQIELNTPSGVSVDINYHISTPTSSSTTLVDQELPCVLFIHAEYLPHEGFEAQFSDPLLRKRFNLISLDLRGYGHTTTLAQADYTPAVAADDIYHFLHALNVSAIHVFGISIGCHVAIELAIAHPEFVSSLTLCTMPPGQEADPPEIMAGRNEVYEFWQDSGDHQGDSTTEVTEDMDEDLITNLVRGIQLMLFGESTVALVEPFVNS
ncbi:hypothetical protein C0991_006966 [Blastosporella zonata]|nr:hypothetical protein C0991_006966 [Blastosporella zonata]